MKTSNTSTLNFNPLQFLVPRALKAWGNCRKPVRVQAALILFWFPGVCTGTWVHTPRWFLKKNGLPLIGRYKSILATSPIQVLTERGTTWLWWAPEPRIDRAVTSDGDCLNNFLIFYCYVVTFLIIIYISWYIYSINLNSYQVRNNWPDATRTTRRKITLLAIQSYTGGNHATFKKFQFALEYPYQSLNLKKTGSCN